MSRKGSFRPERVSGQIRDLLATALRERLSDPRLQGVQITEVALTGDLGSGKVYFYLLQPDDARGEAAEAAFSRAAGMLKGMIGRALRLKRAPELTFIYDRRIDEVRRMNALLDGLNPDAPADDGPGTPDE